MVNSPSQSCSRPAAPPPLGGPARPPFPLPPPAPRAVRRAAGPVPLRSPRSGTQDPVFPSNQTKSNQIKPPCISPVPSLAALAAPPDLQNPESVPQSPQSRQKTPVIVPHQGISRHSPKKHLPLESSPKLGDWNAKLPPPIPFATLRLRAFALKNQQSRLIVPHQGKPPNFPWHPASIPEFCHLCPSALICGHTPCLPPLRNPASVVFSPIKANPPVIVPHQGISRHPPINTHALGAWWLAFGASLTIPFATPRLCVKYLGFALNPKTGIEVLRFSYHPPPLTTYLKKSSPPAGGLCNHPHYAKP